MVWMGSKADIAAITALDTSTMEDGIAFCTMTEKLWIGLDKTSTATVDNTSVWAASPSGRWMLVGGNNALIPSITISSSQPSGSAVLGSQWIWQENNAVNSYDSVISYYYNGSAWIEIDTRMRLHTGTPSSLGKTPNSNREAWKDTSTGTVYGAFNGGWVAGSGAT